MRVHINFCLLPVILISIHLLVNVHLVVADAFIGPLIGRAGEDFVSWRQLHLCFLVFGCGRGWVVTVIVGWGVNAKVRVLLEMVGTGYSLFAS